MKRMRISEELLIDMVTRVTPWLAPLPTAYLVVTALESILQWPFWVALAAGIVTESLGLSAVSTALTFRQHNRGVDEKRLKEYGAPFRIVTMLVGVYLIGVTTMTIVLDTVPSLITYAPLVFLTYSSTSFILIGVRNDHRQRVNTMILSKMRPYHTKRYMGERAQMLADMPEVQTKSQHKLALEPTGSPASNGRKKLTCPHCGKDHGKNGKPILTQQALNAHYGHCEERAKKRTAVVEDIKQEGETQEDDLWNRISG